MRLAAISLGFLAFATMFVVASPGAYAQSETNNETKEEVRPGDTLYGIAHKHGTVYQRLFDANEEIDNPDLIYPGQILRIPDPSEEVPARSRTRAVAEPVSAAPAPVPQPVPQPEPAVAASSAGVWDRLAACESSGNWSINTGNGYYGGLQFSLSSWQMVGGTGYPHLASRTEQISRAERLLAIQGWGAWPACSAQLGLR